MGTLWLWRSSGRPIAAVAIELYPTNWSFEFVSLSSRLVEVNADGLHWAPAKAGVEFREIPDAPAPAAGEAERLRQMRDLLKPFSAREYYNTKSQDYPLRLLTHPIDRYTDSASGLLNGAIFVFANGTNPEALLMIEARSRGSAPPAWCYAATRLSRAELTLKRDAKVVWTCPTVELFNPEDAYYIWRKPRRTTPRDAHSRKDAEP